MHTYSCSIVITLPSYWFTKRLLLLRLKLQAWTPSDLTPNSKPWLRAGAKNMCRAERAAVRNSLERTRYPYETRVL